ncbi:MAG TPA: hypothetical protein VN493_27820 [Thermoanaerobaculia bacterium]|nr:hypothetical protein [Thermoanaerobaculia bacterium]
MIRSKPVARLFLLLALIGGLSAAAAESPVALVKAGNGLLEWIPLVQAESATLTLADPRGDVRAFRFGPGATPALSLFDAEGAPLPDGSYTWELRTAGGAQSGSFTIAEGSLVSPDLSEQPRLITAADQVVPDDLIVDGKGCIGLGCANNEAFGSETLRLKQGVVRLRFQDTSSGAFPGSDWQITANDSASGGANRFSIEDLTAATTPLTIVGGAPSNSIYVTALGRVGFGTATPGSGLHIFSAATSDAFAGMGPDPVSGPALNYGYSGASLGRGSGFFNVRPDASATAPNPSLRFMTVNVERMILTNTGDVGIGTSAPSSRFHVNGGDIRVSGGSFIDDGTTLNVPDYVFAPDYSLMPLDELREFVSRERHLPNVPSAEDVRKEGLNLSEVQMRLLEKVEELTLYTLAQNELVKALEARLAALEKAAAPAPGK